MRNKANYYQLLKVNKGRLNEIEIGEQIGLDENECRSIIAQLLSEHKIEYYENGASNYRLLKKSERSSVKLN